MRFLVELAAGLVTRPHARGKGSTEARAYAIGDIHGRLDLLEEMLELIERDIATRDNKNNFIVFLGDLIDRGPDSRGVVERLRTYCHSAARAIFLAGNHEEVLLRVLKGEPGLLENWLRFGGAECVASYDLDPRGLKRMSENAAVEAIREAIPAEHVGFIESFGDTFRCGDYLFVHAGIRPGVPLHEQNQKDLRWIREPFLSDDGDHDFVVVHGHTVVEAVEERDNRIAIDTGAVYSGLLTALVVEGRTRRYLFAGRTRERVAAAPSQSHSKWRFETEAQRA